MVFVVVLLTMENLGRTEGLVGSGDGCFLGEGGLDGVAYVILSAWL